MNRELSAIAKKYNFLEKIQLNSYVDAIDENRWKVAKIIGFKNIGHRHTITLHFDGFPNNWDEDFDLPAASKLAPFRRFTLPYTGPFQLTRSIHRPPASLNFDQPLSDLKKINKQDKQKLKPDWIIQTFRGQMFILVDNLLTQTIKLRPEEYELVFKFFQSYIETGIGILKFALQKINEISKQNINEPNVIYLNPIYAIVSALPQIMFNFNSMVSSKDKRVKFYSFQENSEQLRKKMKSFLKSKQIVQLCKGILQYQNPPYRGFNWTIKKQALILLSVYEQQTDFPKIADNREISDALDILYYLRSKQIYTQQAIQNIHIQLVMNLILNGNFQGKLKGLAQLKRFCQGSFSLKRQILKQKILTPQLLNALTDNSTFNGEIFKRSLPIFQAAAKYDLLTQQILQRILFLHKDKHQLQLKSFYSTLADFGSILNEKKVIQFFQQFKKFPLEVQTINLIKDYTLNVIKNHSVYKKRYMEAHSGLGLVYLWQIIKQENKSQQIVNQAISAFSILAADAFYKNVIQKYLIECFSNIKAGKNVENSLKIINLCLNKNRQLASIIDNIDKQFSIIDTVIKSMIQSPAMQSKTVESIFQFLQEVNQFARKKITVEHIKDLWKFKSCQKSILKFLRKYNSSSKEKSNDKIINKKLTPPQMKEVISKIFMNKALMDNYVNIDEQSYKAIDQLLISYNHKTKAIQYNYKHCIRSYNVQQLFGLQLYLDIAENCKDQNLMNKCLRRFIEFYLRPASGKTVYSSKTDKVSMWLFCVEKISKYLELSPKKYIGYSILFQQIKGRMLSLNIMDPSDTTLMVYIKNSNIKRSVTLPRCSSLWKLRELINEQFKLNRTNFEVYLSGSNYANDMEKQQDFSVALIQIPKDPLVPAVTVIQSRQTHPHYVAIQEFKTNFSNIYAQKIYQNLNQIKNFQIQLICLKILQQIPIIKSLQAKFSKLQIGKQLTWDQVLDAQCRIRMCYQIGILNRVKALGIPWVINFIKRGGVEHIQKILRQRNTLKGPIFVYDYEFLSQLLTLFHQMIMFYKTSQSNLPFNESSVVQIMKISNRDKSNPQTLSNPIVLDYFYQTFITLQEILKYPIDGIKILTHSSVTQVLQLLLFTDKKTKNQQRFPKILQQIFTKLKCEQTLSNFVQLLLTTYLSNPKMKHTSRVFFDLLVIMFDNNCVNDNLYRVVLQFISKIRFAPAAFFDQKQNKTNQIIYGWLRITKCLILKSITTQNQLKSIPESQQKFADFLIGDGLFKQQHRFESDECRGQAFDILSILSCKDYVMQKIGTQISPILLKGSWRKQTQWGVRSFKKREKDKKVGLKNLAATCYINSLLQQLFYIKEFRQPLLAVNTQAIQNKQNIAYELQKIFANLKYSNREVYSTQSLCQTFIIDGQCIDPRVQMDVDQFFHTLLDKLEFNLMKINKQNIIDDVFKGEYSNLVIGQECQHKSDRVQHFLSMRLQIINKSSLTQALTQFIKGQVLQGQNAYFCQKCDKKIKAVKRVCVKSLPDVLILTLKRFQFDFDRMQKFKLNSFCQFGEDLDMQPYMKQSLYENENKQPSQNYKYKLKGVVIHYGVSEAGHYTSYIKMENGEWKYFDDDKISNFDVKDLGKQSFGGIDDNPYTDNSQRIKNAYLLIYQKVNKNKVGELKTDEFVKSQVDSENINNQQIKTIFDYGLQNFFDINSKSLGKNYLLFVHLVSLRSEKRLAVYKKCYQNCIEIFESNPAVIQWYLKQFSQNMVREFLIYSYLDVSCFVASLLIYAVTRVFYPDFIKRCMKCVDRKNMVPLNKVFNAAAQNPNYYKLLTQYCFHEKFLKIIRQDKCQQSSSLSKLPSIQSQFGDPNLNFYEKKDFRNAIELIQCIENFKFKELSFEDLQYFYKRTKKLSIHVSIAKFFSPKFRDEQSLNHLATKLILPLITKLDPKPDQEYYFRFAIILMNKLCQVKDQYTKKRNNMVASLYGIAIKQSLEGYKAMRILLEGLFSLCFNNQLAREQFINFFSEKDNKKYIKLIRDWMKESDRFYLHVKNDKLGYWRKTTRYSTSAQLERVQNDIKVSPEKYLSLFNSLLQRHKVQFPDLFSPIVKIGERVASHIDFEQFQYEVIQKTGITIKVRNNQGLQKLIFEDDVNPQRSV